MSPAARKQTRVQEPQLTLRPLLSVTILKDDQTGGHYINLHFDTKDLDERAEGIVRMEVRLHEIVATVRPFVKMLQVQEPDPTLPRLDDTPPGPDETQH